MKYVGKKGAAVKRITPGDGHYFFGYYDLQPFNADESLHLVHKTPLRNWSYVDRDDLAEVGIINMETEEYEKLDITHAWNFQQGAMLQWNPKAPDREIIYNDFVDGEYCGVVMDITNGRKRYLDRPVANISRDGKYALNINMARLFDFRPGYGYCAKGDAFYYKNHPKNDGIFLTDMETGKAKLILSYDELWNFTGSYFGRDEKLVVNHITFNTDASRFIALVRNFPPKGARHATALITAKPDGSDMYLLSDYGLQSHYWWLNHEELLFFSDAKEIDTSRGLCNTYILRDKTHEGTLLADGFFRFDNHMSVAPDRKLMITDSYPDSNRHQVLSLYDMERNIAADIGHFHSMENMCGDVRCDLHPRWSRSGGCITFDSTHEGYRGVYKIDLDINTVERLLK